MSTPKPTELSRIKQKFELNSPFLWWVSIRRTWLHCRNRFTAGSGDIHICCLILIVLWHSVFPLWDQDSKLDVSGTHSPTVWISAHKPRLSNRESSQSLNSIARSYAMQLFRPLNATAGIGSSLALAINIFVVLIVMLLHREGILNRQMTSLPPLLSPGFEAGFLRHPRTSNNKRVFVWSDIYVTYITSVSEETYIEYMYMYNGWSIISTMSWSTRSVDSHRAW